VQLQIDAYESLREAVLLSQARPEGLAAVVYHGLFGGLDVVCRQPVAAAGGSGMTGVRAGPAVGGSTADPVLVRLLANMVLFCQQEVSHVV
jgi:hypothetical protein